MNRFVFLHPDMIRAASIGSPGGWPITPLKRYGKRLRYPIGIDDMKQISGCPIHLRNVRTVPMLIYMGDQNANDSVVYFDSYERQDKDLIFELFGDTPINRWDLIKDIYRRKRSWPPSNYILGVKHTVTNEMIDDTVKFFLEH